jgi:hypothetical protein
MFVRDKHSNLLDPFVSCTKNEVSISTVVPTLAQKYTVWVEGSDSKNTPAYYIVLLIITVSNSTVLSPEFKTFLRNFQ